MFRYGDKQLTGLVDLWHFSSHEWRCGQLILMHEDDIAKLLKKLKIETATQLVKALKEPIK